MVDNGILERQLRKRGLSPSRLPDGREAWVEFLDTVARTYNEAEQGRELLERSLAISSEEMRDIYLRQRAISACAQALLLSGDDEAVPTALAEVVNGTDAGCGWIDVNGRAPEDQMARERRWWICAEGSMLENDRRLGWSEVERDSLLPDLAAGRPATVSVATACCGRQAGHAYVPITAGGRWVGTLVTASREMGSVSRGDLEVLQVVARMFGAFTERLDAHHRLRETGEELRALVRSKDQLIASVAHEIRTPLTAILGYARLLHDGRPHVSRHERDAFIEMLVEQGEELTNVVEDLVVAARADLGHLRIATVRVDLRAQTNQVLEAMAPTLRRHVAVSGENVLALGDPSRVRQIIRNLVSNALRYGGPNVAIRVQQDDAGAHLMVTDDGPGVPQADQHLIFEPYHRAHHISGVTQSLGLGLYLCRSLARLMGGDVTYSRSGGTTIFDLLLPPKR